MHLFCLEVAYFTSIILAVKTHEQWQNNKLCCASLPVAAFNLHEINSALSVAEKQINSISILNFSPGALFAMMQMKRLLSSQTNSSITQHSTLYSYTTQM